MKRLIVFLLAAMLWPWVESWSQDVLPNVQYISGRAVLPKKLKGSLVLTEHQLCFNDQKAASVIVIPLSMIKNVTQSVRDNFGLLTVKKEEFLNVDTKGPEGAEALLFKCERGTSPGMVAKIQAQIAIAMKSEPVAEAAPVDSVATAGAPFGTLETLQGSVEKAKRPRSFGRKVAVFALQGTLTEGLIAINASMASGSPGGFGVIFLLLSPLAAGGTHASSKAEKIVLVSTFESIGVYNLIMAAGHHSDEVVFNGNMIAWNAALAITWASSEIIFKKDKAPGGGGTDKKEGWSAGLGMVGDSPGLRVAYRF